MTDTLIFIGIIAAGVIALLLVIMVLFKLIPWFIDIVKDIKEKKRIKKEYPTWTWEQKWQYYEQQAFLNCTDPEYHITETAASIPTEQFIKDLGHEPTKEEIANVHKLYTDYEIHRMHFESDIADIHDKIVELVEKRENAIKEAIINKTKYYEDDFAEALIKKYKKEIEQRFEEYNKELKNRSYLRAKNKHLINF